MSVVVDTSALFALLDRRDAHHVAAAAFWADPDDEDLVTHAYVVIESVALAVFYAATDELHQAFVGGRRPSVVDLGIDATGALIALVVVGRIRSRRP